MMKCLNLISNPSAVADVIIDSLSLWYRMMPPLHFTSLHKTLQNTFKIHLWYNMSVIIHFLIRYLAPCAGARRCPKQAGEAHCLKKEGQCIILVILNISTT